MLLEFKISNYRSIGAEQVISLIPATNQKDHLQNIITQGKHQALNAIALYGPNAGGKSNLLRAISLLDRLVHTSAGMSSTAKLPYDPFVLRSGYEKKPTRLEASFIIDGIRYRYGLEFSEHEVNKEWLFRKSTGREVNIFEREGDIIDVSNGLKGSKKVIDAAIEATRPNALFLSIGDMLNLEEPKKIMQWFKYLHMIDGLNTDDDIRTVTLHNISAYNVSIQDYIRSLNLGILDVQIATRDFDESELPSNLPEQLRKELIDQLKGQQTYKVNAIHNLYDEIGQPTRHVHIWDFYERESAGSQKAFKLSGPILWALSKGGVLIIDEIEAAMHPIMTLNTIDLFLDQTSNPNGAQLIFATHDTNLLSYSKLRRDQICFAEKNKWESTEIYSLSDFVYFEEKNGEFKSEKERPDTDKEKRYFEGRYGAIPILGNFRKFIRETQWPKEEK